MGGMSDMKISLQDTWSNLGPAMGAGNGMAQWMPKCNGNVVPHCSLLSTTDGQMAQSGEEQK